jgi:ubiquinone/menaquinone biosynthesis C-methylase UbiE
VTAGEVRATSFGQVADDYDRVRPGPPAEAIDWLVPQDCETAVDLAAGTGLFTRALRRRVKQVIAVEPDDRMRAVLAARSPDVRAVAGRGEDIPVPDASADGVFVSSAWHWLDPNQAVPEIARVLRDGGRFGVIWTSRDRRTDWVAELDMLRTSHGVESVQDARSQLRRRHEVTLPEKASFENVASASFTFVRTMTVDDAVDWLATYSGVITAPDTERAAGLARARDALLRRAGADGMIEIPMRSTCWRADRVPRPAAPASHPHHL